MKTQNGMIFEESKAGDFILVGFTGEIKVYECLVVPGEVKEIDFKKSLYKRDITIKKLVLEEGIISINGIGFANRGIEKLILPKSLQGYGKFSFTFNNIDILEIKNGFIFEEYCFAYALREGGKFDTSGVKIQDVWQLEHNAFYTCRGTEQYLKVVKEFKNILRGIK